MTSLRELSDHLYSQLSTGVPTAQLAATLQDLVALGRAQQIMRAVPATASASWLQDGWEAHAMSPVLIAQAAEGEVRQALATMLGLYTAPLGAWQTLLMHRPDPISADALIYVLDRSGGPLWLGNVLKAYLTRKEIGQISHQKWFGVVDQIDDRLRQRQQHAAWEDVFGALRLLWTAVVEEHTAAGQELWTLRFGQGGKAEAAAEYAESASSAESGKFAGSAASAEIAASDKSAPATDVPSVEPVEQAPQPDQGPVDSEAQRPEAPKPLWKKLQEDQGQSISTVTLYALEQQLFGQPLASERKGFVDALFEGNTQAYARVLKQLAAVDTWEEASRIIRNDIFLPHHVDIYSGPAVSFTNRVEAYYLKST